MSDTLSNAERRKLKARAQLLKATVKIGKAGLSNQVVQAVNDTLKHHDLVKIRFDEFKTERKTLAPQLAEKTGSELIWMVGHVAVLFRRLPTPAVPASD